MLLKSKTKNVTKMFKKMAVVGAKKKRSMADSSDDSDEEMQAT